MVRCPCGGTLHVAFECYKDIDPATGRLVGRTQIPQDPFAAMRAIECRECYRIFTQTQVKEMARQEESQ